MVRSVVIWSEPYGTRLPKSLVLLAPFIGPDSVDKFSQIVSYCVRIVPSVKLGTVGIQRIIL
jgi:hypothetical protein